MITSWEAWNLDKQNLINVFKLVHLHKFTYLYSSSSSTLIASEDFNLSLNGNNFVCV